MASSALTRSDEQAVAELLFAYAAAIDRGDFEAVGALFTHGEFHGRLGAPVRVGAAETSAMFEAAVRLYPDGTPRTRHVTTNVIVEVDRDADGTGVTATARSYFTVFQAVPGALALQPIIAGSYDDEFHRVGGQWWFRRRRISADLFGDLAQHLFYDITERAR
jgi:3-phenylpropionate/cinnamic acid dioxygenase small subunit